jgi:hypothetical protein
VAQAKGRKRARKQFAAMMDELLRFICALDGPCMAMPGGRQGNRMKFERILSGME